MTDEKELQPVPQPTVPCKFLRGHVWEKWEATKTQMTDHGRYSIIQERRCRDCGLRQIRRDIV